MLRLHNSKIDTMIITNNNERMLEDLQVSLGQSCYNVISLDRGPPGGARMHGLHIMSCRSTGGIYFGLLGLVIAKCLEKILPQAQLLIGGAKRLAQP